MSLVRRHPTIAFFVLVYTLAWGFESPLVFLRDNVTDTQGFVLVLLASNVTSVVGIVLTAILLGRGALRKLLGRPQASFPQARKARGALGDFGEGFGIQSPIAGAIKGETS